MEDREIITLYLNRDGAAISHTREKYGVYCLQIAVRRQST